MQSLFYNKSNETHIKNFQVHAMASMIKCHSKRNSFHFDPSTYVAINCTTDDHNTLACWLSEPFDTANTHKAESKGRSRERFELNLNPRLRARNIQQFLLAITQI